MIYKTFQNLKLPALWFGAMRLPDADGDYATIDQTATAEIISYAMDHGINYFDTAWGYHAGNSEPIIRMLLRKYPRESFF